MIHAFLLTGKEQKNAENSNGYIDLTVFQLIIVFKAINLMLSATLSINTP
jgi:hypothetical protein